MEIFEPGNEALLNEMVTFSLMVEAGSLEPKILARSGEFLNASAYPSADGPLLNLGVFAITVDTGLTRPA